MNGESKRNGKDVWDILDVIGKVLSAVILVVVAILIKVGTDNIAASMQQADYVRNLISDLTSADNNTRRDIALLALDHTLRGKEESGFVSDIAERVLVSFSTTDSLVRQVAFSILEKRDPQRAAKYKARAETILLASRNISANERPTVTGQSYEAVASANLPDFVNGVFQNIVYIQYRPKEMQDVAIGLEKELRKNSIQAPGVELIGFKYRNLIKYFYAEDQSEALTIKSLVDQYLRSIGRVSQMDVTYVNPKGVKVPKGQIEVWLSSDDQ